MLEIAALLCFGIGLIHSYLGERYILISLFKGDKVTHLFGSDYFTKRTLRFAWHITTIAWWGFAYLLWQISIDSQDLNQTVLYTIAVVFLISGLFALSFTKGKHLSWIVFWAIAGVAFYRATNN